MKITKEKIIILEKAQRILKEYLGWKVTTLSSVIDEMKELFSFIFTKEKTSEEKKTLENETKKQIPKGHECR